jgi:AraC-like DNA-binding protein/mannose-6-phosphate isomerase-like protein (cupin superfamily)
MNEHLHPLIIHNQGKKEGEYFRLTSPYNITLQTYHASTQTLQHSYIAPGYYLERSGIVPEHCQPHARPLHHHDSLELMFVLEGQVTQFIEDSKLLYRKGSCCILNKNICHVESYSSDFQAIFVLISDALIEQLISEDIYFPECWNKEKHESALYQELLHFLHHHSEFDKQYLNFTPSTTSSKMPIDITALFHCILNETRMQMPGFYHIIRGYFTRLLSLLSDEQYYQMQLVQMQSSKEDQLFYRITRLLQHHLGRVHYAELERELHYTRDYLNRLVKRRLGLSMVEYGQQLCLEEAARLLSLGTLTVTEIIQTLGYTNRTYFYQLFQEHFGMTPKQYQNMEQGERKGTR